MLLARKLLIGGGPSEFIHTIGEDYTSNGTLANYLIDQGWDGEVFANVTIDGKCYPGTYTTGMRTGSFPNGLKLTLNDKVYGRGGGGMGSNGSTAMHIECVAEIIGGSSCYILGGGGGGARTDMMEDNSGGGGGAGGGYGYHPSGIYNEAPSDGTAGGAGGAANYYRAERGADGGWEYPGTGGNANTGGGDGGGGTSDGSDGYTYGSTGGAGGGGGWAANGGGSPNNYQDGGSGGNAIHTDSDYRGSVTLGGYLTSSSRLIGGVLI